MGKIRIATLGGETEEELRKKQKVKREEKKKRIHQLVDKKIHISGMKGGERIKQVGAETEEELERLAKLAQEVGRDQEEGIKVKEEKPKRKIKIRQRSKRYNEAALKVDRSRRYPIREAIQLLRRVSLAKFDGAVELHINTTEKGLRGNVMLPHGIGKQAKVMIVDIETIDALLAQVEKGKIDFDALVAHPQVMPKLAKIAKYLGPRGLMPNPKAGTISETPEKVAERLAAGEISWKTEGEFPLIHQMIGKISFNDEQLIENFNALMKSIGESKIKSIILKSTISPGIPVGHRERLLI